RPPAYAPTSHHKLPPCPTQAEDPRGRSSPQRTSLSFRGSHATKVSVRFATTAPLRRRHRHLTLRPLRLLPARRPPARRRRTAVRRVRRRLSPTAGASRRHPAASRPRSLPHPPRCRP